MMRGTTTVAPPLPDEVGQGPSEFGRPLTAVQDLWAEGWTPPEHKDLVRRHALARKRERVQEQLTQTLGHSPSQNELEELEFIAWLEEADIPASEPAPTK